MIFLTRCATISFTRRTRLTSRRTDTVTMITEQSSMKTVTLIWIWQ